MNKWSRFLKSGENAVVVSGRKKFHPGKTQQNWWLVGAFGCWKFAEGILRQSFPKLQIFACSVEKKKLPNIYPKWWGPRWWHYHSKSKKEPPNKRQTQEKKKWVPEEKLLWLFSDTVSVSPSIGSLICRFPWVPLTLTTPRSFPWHHMLSSIIIPWIC